MTETMPERIWIDPDIYDDKGQALSGDWSSDYMSGQCHEYVRADLARPAPAEGAGSEKGPFEVSRSSDGVNEWFSARDPAAGVTIPAKDRDDAVNLTLSLNRSCVLFSALSSPEDATPAGDKCDDCQRHYQAVYSLPNEVWSQIAPQPETLGSYIEHQGGGLLCPDCASSRAADKGIALRFTGTDGWPDATPAAPVSVEDADSVTVPRELLSQVLMEAADNSNAVEAELPLSKAESESFADEQRRIEKLQAIIAQQDRRAALREMQSIREEMEGESGA